MSQRPGFIIFLAACARSPTRSRGHFAVSPFRRSAFRRSARPAGGLVPHPTRAGAGLAIWPFRRFAVSPFRPGFRRFAVSPFRRSRPGASSPTGARPRPTDYLAIPVCDMAVSPFHRFAVSPFRPRGPAGSSPTRPAPGRGSPYGRFAVSPFPAVSPRFRHFAFSPFRRSPTRCFVPATARGTDYLATYVCDMAVSPFRRFAVSPFRPRAGGLVPHRPTRPPDPRRGRGLAIWPFRRFAVSPSRPSHITSVWRHACAA